MANTPKIELADFVRDVPDFPKKGIVFKDITPLLGSHHALREAIAQLCEPFRNKGIDTVIGIESRGFIFGSIVAQELQAGFVPIRKRGKLPYKTVSASYDLEYGTDQIEIHSDALAKGAKVLIIDDLLATGGTMAAACQLVEKVGGQVAGIAFVIELCFLAGRQKLAGYNVHSLMQVK
jgi:adenine phosphoribosyltransferase